MFDQERFCRRVSYESTVPWAAPFGVTPYPCCPQFLEFDSTFIQVLLSKPTSRSKMLAGTRNGFGAAVMTVMSTGFVSGECEVRVNKINNSPLWDPCPCDIGHISTSIWLIRLR